MTLAYKYIHIIQAILPFQVNSGDIEDDAFEPEDHKESLREWTISNAFPITACLHRKGQIHTVYKASIGS